MTKFTVASIGMTALALCAAVATFGTSTRAASSTPAPSPVVSVTTLPALPSPAVATAHPGAMSPSASSAPAPIAQPTSQSPLPPSPGALIAVTGRVAKPVTVTIDQLRNMHQVSLTMRVVDPDGKHRFHIFSGASLPGVIDQAQPLTVGGTQNAIAAWAIVTGLSGGPAVVAFPEFESDFGGHRAILAYTVDGKAVEQGVMLVIEGDATSLRFVRGVTKIDVEEAPR